MSCVGFSCPQITTPVVTMVWVAMPSVSVLFLVCPPPPHNPLRKAIFRMSRSFLYSSNTTNVLTACDTRSFMAGTVDTPMLGGSTSCRKNDSRQVASVVLPVPFSPNRFRIGKCRVRL
ncbi:hypothetical protein EVA_06983 [gut metagenome]|uniref:Uncharacterized protein n=1 Tax=gut metagenome TaxID=749906 RepID=J9GQY3_9ZZZZ